MDEELGLRHLVHDSVGPGWGLVRGRVAFRAARAGFPCRRSSPSVGPARVAQNKTLLHRSFASENTALLGDDLGVVRHVPRRLCPVAYALVLPVRP